MRTLGPILLLLAACSGEADKVPVPGHDGVVKTAALARAARRAYDGAPPTIPHQNFGMGCMNCHTERGMSVPQVGFAPPMPHEITDGLSAVSRCTQCHVFRETDETFRGSGFVGLEQDLRTGDRAHLLAPPVLPHPIFMRENCVACHTGPAAREEIRCDHPERPRCTQCHLPRLTGEEFSR